MNKNRFVLVAFVALVTSLAGFKSHGQEEAVTNRWRVVRLSLAENPNSAQVLLEPTAPRQKGSTRNREDEAEARRVSFVISKDNSLISWPGRVAVDFSSTNEMQSLVPLLRAYREVVVVAGRQPGWEAELCLQEFQFEGDIPRRANSGPDTRKSEAELEAAFKRLQVAGAAYSGAIGRPKLFKHDDSGPRAPEILFDAGDDRPWVALMEPEALLFALETISELRATHQKFVEQRLAQTAERERLVLTRRRAEERTAEAEQQQRVSAEHLTKSLENKRGQADTELRALAETITGLPRAALRMVEESMSSPFPAGSKRAKLRAQLHELDGDPYAELPARGDPNASRLLRALPSVKGTPSTPGGLQEAVGILEKLQTAMAEDEQEHTGQLVLLVGAPGAREIQTNGPSRRVSMLKQLLNSDPALNASDRGLAWAVTLLDKARFFPERFLEIQEARRRTVLGFLASEDGQRLCRQIESLYVKMLPELKALHAKRQRAGQIISEAQEDAMQGEEAWKTRQTMREATKLMLQGEPDSLQQMRVQMQHRLEEFESATRVSYDEARPWVLEKLK